MLSLRYFIVDAFTILFLLILPLATRAADKPNEAEKHDDTQATDRLPQPHYHRQPSDPAWLAAVVQFHGHLGPSVVGGTRMGMIGLRAVAAKGYFDLEVTCEGPLAKPPQSCFLDGVQFATGATLGKADRSIDSANQCPANQGLQNGQDHLFVRHPN